MRAESLSTKKTYELERIFSNILFLSAILPNCWRVSFFLFFAKNSKKVLFYKTHGDALGRGVFFLLALAVHNSYLRLPKRQQQQRACA